VRFDRWQYDPGRNCFEHRPVVAIIHAANDHAYACALLQAHLDRYARLIDILAAAFETQLTQLQRRIEGDGE
jgi:hypothetical protein